MDLVKVACNEHNLNLGHTHASCGYDEVETKILQITRYFFSAFANPASQNWMFAFAFCKSHWCERNGPAFADGCLEVVSAMRLARKATFCFSNPFCLKCSLLVTPHERYLMACVQSARRGQKTLLATHAMMLCEGEKTELFISALNTFIQRFDLTIDCNPHVERTLADFEVAFPR